MEIKPLHRDDVPYDHVEKIIQQLKEAEPGMELVFAGDVPPDQLPEEVKLAIEYINTQYQTSREEGRCVDCGGQMPGWPDEVIDVEKRTFNLPAGWQTFEMSGNEELGVAAFQCPDCDLKERQEDDDVIDCE